MFHYVDGWSDQLAKMHSEQFTRMTISVEKIKFHNFF